MKKVFLSLFLAGSVLGVANAQVNIGGIPWSISNTRVELQRVPMLKLATPDFEKAKKEDDANINRPGSFRVALPVSTDINLNNTGSFTYLPDGSKIWRAKISVPTSIGLKVFYKAFQLPKGVTYFVTNENGKQLVGGFDYRSNVPEKVMGHEMIEGETANLEMDIEPGVDVSAIEFEISRMYGVYRGSNAFIRDYVSQDDIVAKPTEYAIGDADTCQINAKCPAAASWQQISKTSAHIWIPAGGGGGFCSGNLINNTAKDCAPYFLTAMHCDDGNGKTNSYFDNWEFTFGLEAPLCGGGGTIPKNKVLTGANFAARSDYPASEIGKQNPAFTGDFLLLRLRDQSNQLKDWDTYLGGWDRNLLASDTVWVSFHHPRGDIKKFTKFKNLSAGGTFNQSAIPATHWQVAYTMGGSEPGSSGSALFNGSNGRIIGDLSGGSGSSACAANSRSLYSKLSRNWEYPEGDGTAASQLKTHLDPGGTNAMTTEMAKLVGGSSCGDTPFSLTPSSVKDIEELSNAILVYPNPSTGAVRMKVNMPNPTDLSIAVVNILGAKVGSFTAKGARSGEVVLDLNRFANGVYLLQISSDKATISKKVVLNR